MLPRILVNHGIQSEDVVLIYMSFAFHGTVQSETHVCEPSNLSSGWCEDKITASIMRVEVPYFLTSLSHCVEK